MYRIAISAGNTASAKAARRAVSNVAAVGCARADPQHTSKPTANAAHRVIHRTDE
jgi:hypothetical protein